MFGFHADPPSVQCLIFPHKPRSCHRTVVGGRSCKRCEPDFQVLLFPLNMWNTLPPARAPSPTNTNAPPGALNTSQSCLSGGSRRVCSSASSFLKRGAFRCRGKTGMPRCSTEGMSLISPARSRTSSSSWWMTKASGTLGTTGPRSKPRHWTGWQRRESSWRITTCSRSAAPPGASSWPAGTVPYEEPHTIKTILINLI